MPGTRDAYLAAMKVGVLLSMFWLSGCVNLADVARERGAADLKCPSDQISTYRAADGAVVARGCDAWTEYQCFFVRTGPICVREAPAQVNASAPRPATPQRAGDSAHSEGPVQPSDQRPGWN
jgi:hypothetical protein